MVKAAGMMLTAVICLAVMASCKTVSETKSETASSMKFDDKVLLSGKAMVAAFKDGDYQKFVQHLSDGLKQDFSGKSFDEGRRQVMDSAGEVSGMRYLGKLDGPVFSNFLWAVKFSRSTGEKSVVQELLFKVTAAQEDSGVSIVSFGFML